MALDSLDDGLENLIGSSRAGCLGSSEDDLLPAFEDLTPFEVEHFVNDMHEFRLEEVGNSRWLTHHERIEKLNWTAHNQANEGLDEYVVDQFNTLEKVPMLIFDLMLIEVWKEKIWPLVKAKIAKFSSLRTYIPVYHEASVANLIEICLFHRTTCEEAGDALIDLVDWCVRKLRYLLSVPNSELVRQITSAKETAEWDSIRSLDEQFLECEFQVCMCAISILRFLTDHRVAMPLGVTTRLLETHDVLMLLVPLMEKAPWVRKNRNNGRIEKFEDHKWERVEADDEGRLPKLHTQVWLAIYNLAMDQECRSRYELTSFRKENLLRLRRFINEVVVDQLPPLTNLHRTLEEIAISGHFTGATPASTVATPFVVELVAEAREMLVRSYEGRWEEVADQQLREVLVKESPDELKRLGNMICVPKDMFDEPAAPASVPEADAALKATATGEDLAPAAGGSRGDLSREAAAWEVVTSLPLVVSTASFFAAARAEDSPADEVLVLTAAPQAPPKFGERLHLELRRARYGSLGASGVLTAKERVASDQFVAKRAQEIETTFLLAVDAPGVSPSAVRSKEFVSQKGAPRTAQQLTKLLSKPGNESVKAMYVEDVAEFSVPVGDEQGSLDISYIAGLSCCL